jgi:hypothetical protein
MRNKELISKRELFFRRLAALSILGITIYIFEFKIKRNVDNIFGWFPIMIFLVVLYQLAKDVKQKNYKKHNL